MSKKILAGLMIVGLILGGCGTGPSTTDPEAAAGSTANQPVEKRVVKIGVIAPLSGPGSSIGEDETNVITDAVNEFNSGNNKVFVKLILEDGKGQGADAVSAAQKLINIDKVDMLFGGAGSSEAIPVGKIANDKKVVDIAIAGAPKITELGEYVYRHENALFVVDTIINYLNRNTTGVHLLVENTEFGLNIYNEFTKKYTGNILSDQRFDSPEKDFAIVAKKIKKNSDGYILLITQNDSSTLSIIRSLAK